MYMLVPAYEKPIPGTFGARGEAPAGSIEERIANFRKRIAERKANEGKDYLSFYSITADNYEIL